MLLPLHRVWPLWVALLCLGACDAPDSPEQQVRSVFEQMEAAAEARDVDDLMAFVSSSYRDAHGLGPDEASRYVRGYFIANQSLHLLTRIEGLEFPSQDEALATVLVGMAGREADASDSWNLVADLYEFKVALLREDGDWKVSHAQWERK